ncbi:hypothetical protein [Streptomyces sp. NPDC021020]|uniref:hypothetical protein n=1 Tax=Streptomyces sp. NPDC021020 TaxID=3365109 RepID=UPI0037B58652
MNAARSRLPTAFIGCALVAAAGAVTAIVGAVQHRYAQCSVALFALAASALAAYLISRRLDAATDRSVLERILANPAHDAEALAAELGFRPAAVRLSMRRLARSGQAPRDTEPG